MTLHLPTDKVRDLASVIGKLNAVNQAVLPGRLEHRFLLQAKIDAIRVGATYDTEIELPQQAVDELHWWTSTSDWNGRALLPSPADVTLTTDASELVGAPSPATALGQHASSVFRSDPTTTCGLVTAQIVSVVDDAGNEPKKEKG